MGVASGIIKHGYCRDTHFGWGYIAGYCSHSDFAPQPRGRRAPLCRDSGVIKSNAGIIAGYCREKRFAGDACAAACRITPWGNNAGYSDQSDSVPPPFEQFPAASRGKTLDTAVRKGYGGIMNGYCSHSVVLCEGLAVIILGRALGVINGVPVGCRLGCLWGCLLGAFGVPFGVPFGWLGLGWLAWAGWAGLAGLGWLG